MYLVSAKAKVSKVNTYIVFTMTFVLLFQL